MVPDAVFVMALGQVGWESVRKNGATLYYLNSFCSDGLPSLELL